MGFTKEASKLLTNKYFLYFMVFLSATNIIGYLVTNKLNAVAFFIIVGLLSYHFSKNMAIVLLISLVATNFLVANKKIREGLENNDDVGNAVKNAINTDPSLNDVVSAVKSAKSNDDVKTTLQTDASNNNVENNDSTNNVQPSGAVKQNIQTDISNNDVQPNETTTENFGGRLKGSRIDYGSTIEQSYANLDNLLGSDSIKQLSTDTQKLMLQQQNLFNTMNQMVPVLQGAKDMLKGFDIGGLTKSLQNVDDMKLNNTN